MSRTRDVWPISKDISHECNFWNWVMSFVLKAWESRALLTTIGVWFSFHPSKNAGRRNLQQETYDVCWPLHHHELKSGTLLTLHIGITAIPSVHDLPNEDGRQIVPWKYHSGEIGRNELGAFSWARKFISTPTVHTRKKEEVGESSCLSSLYYFFSSI